MVLIVIENPEEIRNGSLRTALVSGVENLLVPVDLLDNNPNLERERRIAIQSALENKQNYNPQPIKINGREYIYYELVGGGE